MRGSIKLRISRSLSQLLYLISQFHRTNPELRDDYWDSSGMTFYYTPNLRPHDAGMLITGEMHLLLPPMQEKYVFSNMHVFGRGGGRVKICFVSLLCFIMIQSLSSCASYESFVFLFFTFFRITVESQCSSRCTKNSISEPIKLISGWHHMHYLGNFTSSVYF